MTRSKYLTLAAIVALGVVAVVKNVPNPVAHAAFGIASCQPIFESGPWELTQNLVASGDCLVVQADDVTIDLAGYTITGDRTGVGIRGEGFRQRVSIRNGTIRNFQDGITFPAGGQDVLIEGVTVGGNARDGLVANNNAIVKNSRFTGNGRSGVSVATHSVLTGNSVQGNRGLGAQVFGLSTVIGNTFNENGGGGLRASFDGSTVVNNTVGGNSSFGLTVGCPSNVFANTATNTFGGPNMVLNGVGCQNNFNVAP